jgi:addiction module HigA family antidote
LTVADAAKGLGISRKSLSQLLNGKAGVSPEMAMRLSLAFGTSPQSWLNHQTQFDLWKIRSIRRKLKVRRLAA